MSKYPLCEAIQKILLENLEGFFESISADIEVGL